MNDDDSDLSIDKVSKIGKIALVSSTSNNGEWDSMTLKGQNAQFKTARIARIELGWQKSARVSLEAYPCPSSPASSLQMQFEGLYAFGEGRFSHLFTDRLNQV
ncbi:MAG: hypothetical protein L0312_29790 [Acidobacteria bacterium]|nr:hypothetical protein [Acidobacteriota bacterium]